VLCRQVGAHLLSWHANNMSSLDEQFRSRCM
jgi:hypothetical protein